MLKIPKLRFRFVLLKSLVLFFLSSSILILLGCGKKQIVTHQWFAMDTQVVASIYGVPEKEAEAAFSILEKETTRLNLLLSDYDSTSALSLLQGNIGDTIKIPKEILEILTLATDIHKRSGGSFDFTLHDLKKLWGLGSNETPKLPDSLAIQNLLKLHRPDSSKKNLVPLNLLAEDKAVIQLSNVQLDLGAIAKGYVIDRMNTILDSLGFTTHLLQAGGEIRLGGKKSSGPWNVGIRHPRQPDSICGKITLSEGAAVSTSGDYERFFFAHGKRYHHIFNPFTGYPAEGICEATVMTASSHLSDALSTSMFVMGPEKGKILAEQEKAQVVWIREIPEPSPSLCYEATKGWNKSLKMSIPPCQL